MSFIFNAGETPQDRDARKQKAVAEALYGVATKQPTDVGSGLASLGSALAYRRMQGQQSQAGADPWAGLRQTTAGSGSPLAMIRGFFGGGR